MIFHGIATTSPLQIRDCAMTTRKRRPGAGRKPSGGFAGNSAWLSTRITPEGRASRDGAPAANGQSLSQEIERRLRESFAFSNRGSAHGPPPDHLKALF